VKMTLCRTKDGRYLAAAGREAAPEGSEIVEPSNLSLSGLQAVITPPNGRTIAAVEVLGEDPSGVAMVGL